jgi:hypothetical protein
MFSPRRTTSGRAEGVRGRPRRVDAAPERFLRLVANPFLAMAAGVGWLAALKAVSWSGRIDVLLQVLVCLVLIGLLPQYHCLDCGRTGRLSAWRLHRCEAVRCRIEAGLARRFRGPKPLTQTIFWVMATLAVFGLCLVAELLPIG